MDVLSSLLDNLDEALFILDKEGRILLFNKVATEFGDSFLIKPFQAGDYLIDSMNLEKSLFFRDAIRETKVRKGPVKSFEDFTTQNGVKVYLEFSFVPVITEEGIETYIHLFIRDITAQKVFEKKLTTQAANITNLIENANAVIIGIDTQGYITDWNIHCTEVTGFEKNEAYAQKLTDLLLDEKEIPVFDELVIRGLNHEAITNHEMSIHHKEGKQRIFLLNCTSRTTTTGVVIGLLFVGQDITELTEYRKSLELKVEEKTRALQQALKKEQEVVEMKNRFVSIASHEFRSPLSSIEFETNAILRTRRIDRIILKKRLETIQKQTGHMNRLLDDVLSYGKSETGKIQLFISDIFLLEFLKRVIDEVSHRPEKHRIKTDYRNLPLVIRADEKLLRSILINLLTNAIKFSPNKEQVYLTVVASKKEIAIKVSDEGLGIPKDELTRIFEPFLRGKGVEAIQGTGLGLSIVKKSVELLNGSVQVNSELNKGTTFNVTIPLLQPPPL
jgi:PAS domain S-box-containing protein